MPSWPPDNEVMPRLSHETVLRSVGENPDPMSVSSPSTSSAEWLAERKKKGGDWKRISLWFGVLLASILLATFVPVLSVTLSRQAEKPPTFNPDQSSTSENDFAERRVVISSLLVGFTDASVLQQPGTPQSKALEWLVYKDKSINKATIARLPQRYALFVFFYACGGTSWAGYQTSIEKDGRQHECSFSGITCEEVNETVISIDLHDESLVGQIPSEIGLLSRLTSINLGDNGLKGTIPEVVFSKFSNLESLNLSANEFASTMSTSIGKLTNLEFLDLSNNQFSGELLSLENLRRLEELRLDHNKFEGTILKLISSWPSIRVISLSFSNVTGSIPYEIGGNMALEELSLEQTQIRGSIPSEIALASNLRNLVLVGQFQGPIPAEIVNLSKLEVLGLGSALFNGTLPEDIQRLTSLKSIAVANTGMVGTLPSTLGLLSALTSLQIFESAFTGTVPSELARLPKLALLVLAFTRMNGTLSTSFCRPGLEILRSCRIACDCCDNTCIGTETRG